MGDKYTGPFTVGLRCPICNAKAQRTYNAEGVGSVSDYCESCETAKKEKEEWENEQIAEFEESQISRYECETGRYKK